MQYYLSLFFRGTVEELFQIIASYLERRRYRFQEEI
jgi:hypothetical protein